MCPKDAEGIANSVDPDQTAPLIWVCTVCPDLSVRKLRIITVLIYVPVPVNFYYNNNLQTFVNTFSVLFLRLNRPN